MGVASVHAHKIDSTLRGNWAAEIAARHGTSGRPVLVVPALPALGRICRDGTVLEHGRPVAHGDDARRTAADSRPAALLLAAGAPAVIELADADAVRRWFLAADGIAVADAATEADLAAIGSAWAAAGATTLLAGTSASIAASIAALAPERSVPRSPHIGAGRIVVVCGSLHPAARRQIAALEAAVADHSVDGSMIDIVTSAVPARVPVDPRDAEATAADLAARAGGLIAGEGVAAVIVLGGDTAAALMGETTWLVGGTVAPGTPWSRRAGDAALHVTRAGGFGDDEALVRLIHALAPSPAGRRS